MSLLLVERGTPGCSVRDIGKLGHRGVELCEVQFDDADVRRRNLLGDEPGQGCTRCSRRSTGDASTWPPRAWGSPAPPRGGDPRRRPSASVRLADRQDQAIKLALAGMAIRVQAARPLTTTPPAASIARPRQRGGDGQGVRVEARSTVDGGDARARRLRVHHRVPVERFYRDAPLMAIGEGTNEILQLLIADRLLAKPEHQGR